jgi:hypothetical protein
LDIAAYGIGGSANFFANGQADVVRAQRVSTGYFQVLGVRPLLGREFTAVEDSPGGPAAAVLSYEFWQRVFHGDSSVLGKTITLRGAPSIVVGVMPKGFRVDRPADLWTPLRPSQQGEGEGDNYGVIARLKPGVSCAAARAHLRALSRLLRRKDLEPGTVAEERILPLQQGTAYDSRFRSSPRGSEPSWCSS